MKVETFTDLMHHVVNKTNFDSESDFIKAHELVDSQFPQPVTPEATTEAAAQAEADALNTGEAPADLPLS